MSTETEATPPTCYGSVHVLPAALVVSQPVSGVHALTGEGGAGEDEGPLGDDPLESAGARAARGESGVSPGSCRRRLPGGGSGFHQAVQVVQVVVRGKLLLRAGTQRFGFQGTSEDA